MMFQHDANLRLNAQQVADYIIQICDPMRPDIIFCNTCCLSVDRAEDIGLKSQVFRSENNSIPDGDTETSLATSNKWKNKDPDIPMEEISLFAAIHKSGSGLSTSGWNGDIKSKNSV